MYVRTYVHTWWVTLRNVTRNVTRNITYRIYHNIGTRYGPYVRHTVWHIHILFGILWWWRWRSGMRGYRGLDTTTPNSFYSKFANITLTRATHCTRGRIYDAHAQSHWREAKMRMRIPSKQLILTHFWTKFRSGSPRLENFSNRGFGKNQRNWWENPFSAFAGISINPLATPGWVNPPTVKLVEDITKVGITTDYMYRCGKEIIARLWC